ncbi:hypothetical protein QQZ08_005130 [Neonectria magnoliae]|uniref:Uncharacterized protein n=1 Tax=Neonectria magnoliae TaxID=2732573 RepID=A0ABR1I636_9HYPO
MSRLDFKPQKPPERVMKDVVAMLAGMPKGKRSWDDYKPRSEEDIRNLFHGLILAEKPRAERAALAWEQLLADYGEAVSSASEDEGQMYVAVYTAASVVAMRLGDCTEMLVHEKMALLNLKQSALRMNRVAVPKLIRLLDLIAERRGDRAYEILLRRKAMLNNAGRLTDSHFSVVDQMLSDPKSLYVPADSLPSALLRIPDILYELLGGEQRLVRSPSTKQVAGKELRPLQPDDIAAVFGVRMTRRNPIVHDVAPRCEGEFLSTWDTERVYNTAIMMRNR